MNIFLGGLSCKRPVKHLIPTGQGEWFAPSNVEDLLAILDQMEPEKTARFVGGNTARGLTSKACFISFKLSSNLRLLKLMIF